MSEEKAIARNKKAFYNYEIISKYEAGIVLHGCEVKSIRAGNINIRDSFARIDRGELWLYNCHISPYKQGNIYNDEPMRNRKLLMHKKEISRLMGKVQEKGLTLLPLSVYLKNNKVKVQLGLGKAKKMFDKRRTIKEKIVKREAERGLKG